MEPKGPLPESAEKAPRPSFGTRVVVIVFALLGPAIVGFGVWARTQLRAAPQAAPLAEGWSGPIATNADTLFGATERGIEAQGRRGEPARVLVPAAKSVTAIAASGGWVYWTSRAPGIVTRAPTGGGAVEVVVRGQADSDAVATTIAAEGDAVFVGVCDREQKHGRVERVVAKAEGATRTVVADGGCPNDLALGPADVVWIEDGRLRRAPKSASDPGAARTLLEDVAIEGPLVVVGDAIYLERRGPVHVGPGGALEPITVGGEGRVLAADATHVYFAHTTAGRSVVSRVRFGTQAMEIVAEVGGGEVAHLVADGGDVFFTTKGGDLLAVRGR